MPQCDLETSFKIGDWKANRSLNLLERDGQSIRIEPRTMDVLLYLAARPGEVVSINELIEVVWQNNVTDGSVYRVMNQLRRILKNGGGESQYIQTVPKRGYRLIARVEGTPAPADASDKGVGVSTSFADASLPLLKERRDQSTKRGILYAISVPVVILAGLGLLGVGIFGDSVPLTEQTSLSTSDETFSLREDGLSDEIPTRSTQAYENYIRGHELAYENMWEAAAEMYEWAVWDDPEFALAWAALSRAHSWVYWSGEDRTQSRLNRALEAVERALEIDPSLPEAHLAMGIYNYRGSRNYALALSDLDIAEQDLPDSSELFATRSWIQRRLGQWEQSLETMAHAIRLDPKHANQLLQQARTYLHLHDYEQAMEHYEHAMEARPDLAGTRVAMAHISFARDGDVTAMKAAYREGVKNGERNWVARTGWTAAIYERDYEAAIQILDEWDRPFFWDDETYISKEAAYGVTYRLAGQTDAAEMAFGEARAALEGYLARHSDDPDDPRVYIALGEVLAGLGQHEAAIEAARHAMEVLPSSVDAFAGPIIRLQAVRRVLIPAGDHDSALRDLDSYLGMTGSLHTAESLLPDPRLDPIRDDARFIELVEKYQRQ